MFIIKINITHFYHSIKLKRKTAELRATELLAMDLRASYAIRYDAPPSKFGTRQFTKIPIRL